MSVHSLELLRRLGFLNADDSVADISRHSPKVLSELLDQYRDERIAKAAEDFEDENRGGDFWALNSSVSASNSVSSLLPSAFVYGRVFVDDPLSRLSSRPNKAASALNETLGLNDPMINVDDVVEALQFFSDLNALIRIGVGTVWPTRHAVSSANFATNCGCVSASAEGHSSLP